MSTNALPLHQMGGLLASEIELLVVKEAVKLQRGYETMLTDKLEQHKQALDERLDNQDAKQEVVLSLAEDTNKTVKELVDKHHIWHEDDVTFRSAVNRDIAELKKQVKAIRIIIAWFNMATKSAKFIFENGDKATGLTLKLILAIVTYLAGQSVYFRWLAPLFHKGH